RAASVVHRHRAASSGEYGKGAISIGSVHAADHIGPVVIDTIQMPDAVTAIDDIVELWPTIAVPEAQRKARRVDQIDLTRDRGLNSNTAACGHGTERQAVVGERAAIAEHTVDAAADGAACCVRHIDRAVEHQLTADHDEVLERAAIVEHTVDAAAEGAARGFRDIDRAVQHQLTADLGEIDERGASDISLSELHVEDRA